MSDRELVRAWRGLLERYHATSSALERALNDQHRLGVSEFEVLDWLVESPAGKTDCRVQDLAGSLHLSQSALSRLIDRLVKHGLVERCSCGEDRRGIYVLLTPAGLRMHAEAASVHREVLARILPPALVQCQCTDTVPA